nr:hypothetical protein CFP56_11443 [Quercus suber]
MAGNQTNGAKTRDINQFAGSTRFEIELEVRARHPLRLAPPLFPPTEAGRIVCSLIAPAVCADARQSSLPPTPRRRQTPRRRRLRALPGLPAILQGARLPEVPPVSGADPAGARVSAAGTLPARDPGPRRRRGHEGAGARGGHRRVCHVMRHEMSRYPPALSSWLHLVEPAHWTTTIDRTSHPDFPISYPVHAAASSARGKAIDLQHLRTVEDAWGVVDNASATWPVTLPEDDVVCVWCADKRAFRGRPMGDRPRESHSLMTTVRHHHKARCCLRLGKATRTCIRL